MTTALRRESLVRWPIHRTDLTGRRQPLRCSFSGGRESPMYGWTSSELNLTQTTDARHHGVRDPGRDLHPAGARQWAGPGRPPDIRVMTRVGRSRACCRSQLHPMRERAPDHRPPAIDGTRLSCQASENLLAPRCGSFSLPSPSRPEPGPIWLVPARGARHWPRYPGNGRASAGTARPSPSNSTRGRPCSGRDAMRTPPSHRR